MLIGDRGFIAKVRPPLFHRMHRRWVVHIEHEKCGVSASKEGRRKAGEPFLPCCILFFLTRYKKNDQNEEQTEEEKKTHPYLQCDALGSVSWMRQRLCDEICADGSSVSCREAP